MFRKSRTFRWLLTAVLVLSTGVAAIGPPAAESAFSISGTSAPETSAKTCCCGTVTGDCCGMGCCSAKEAPTPDGCPGPARDDGSNRRNSPLGCVWTQLSLATELHRRNVWSRIGDTNDRSLADATLQAIHVRLDT